MTSPQKAGGRHFPDYESYLEAALKAHRDYRSAMLKVMRRNPMKRGRISLPPSMPYRRDEVAVFFPGPARSNTGHREDAKRALYQKTRLDFHSRPSANDAPYAVVPQLPAEVAQAAADSERLFCLDLNARLEAWATACNFDWIDAYESSKVRETLISGLLTHFGIERSARWPNGPRARFDDEAASLDNAIEALVWAQGYSIERAAEEVCEPRKVKSAKAAYYRRNRFGRIPLVERTGLEYQWLDLTNVSEIAEAAVWQLARNANSPHDLPVCEGHPAPLFADDGSPWPTTGEPDKRYFPEPSRTPEANARRVRLIAEALSRQRRQP